MQQAGQWLRRALPQGQRLPFDAWQARHRAIVALLSAHALVVPVIAVAKGLPAWHAALESMVLPLMALAASNGRLDRRARTAAASLGLLSASGILVHLFGGLIEMHFHFFVMVGVVALYQDWIPFLTAIAYVLLHHGIVGVLDANSVYNHAGGRENPWKWAAIHAAFIGAMSVGCLVTWRFNEDTLADRDRAEESLREAGARLAVLAEATKILNSSLEVDGVVRGLARLVAPTIADYCVLDLVADDGSVRRIASVATTERRDWTVEMPAADVRLQHTRTDGSDAIEWIGDAILDPEYRSLVAHDPPTSAIVVPVVGREGRLGTLWLATGSTSGRCLTDEDRPFAEELGHRVATAVSNARSFARQRSLAETLQHSLLPDRLPHIPGVESAARYLAGGPGVEVGGDWYDVIQLPGGRIGLAIGDVVGKGEKAAALMGHLRSALRAYGMDGRTPAEVMDRLNALLLDTGPDQMATVVYVVLDPESGLLTFVNAGHPPPLLAAADGTASYLDDTRGMPVGALPGAHYVESTATMAPGALLVMYTDGLVEDRENPIDVGLERLRRAVVAGPADLDALCARVLAEALAGRETHDDTAVLAVRLQLLTPTLDLRVPAHPNTLAPLRTTMRRWLSDRGATDAECFEILVASGELFTNAIRHGTGSRAHFDVHADVDDGVLISVRNHGPWRERRGGIGGRGLEMVEQYADRVEIRRGEAETEVRMHRRLGVHSSVTP